MLQTTVIGHLGNDAIQKEVNGKKVANFSVAHTEKYKTGDGSPTERTTWLECAYWNEALGVVPYLKKGILVYVQGSPIVETYVSKEGVTKAAFRLRVNNIQLLGPSKQEGSAGGNGSMASQAVSSNDLGESADDLPF